MGFDPSAYLDEIPVARDEDIDVGKGALALAALFAPGISTDRYFNHLESLSRDVAAAHAAYIDAGGSDDAETRLASLKRALSDGRGYVGEDRPSPDPQDAGLIRLIDRGRGSPCAIALLYIRSGRAQGWSVEGLDFPGRFLCRIEKDGRRIVFDSSNACKVFEAAGLRALVKSVKGPNAELSAGYFESFSNRALLVRLHNEIKYRMIDAEDYEGAVAAVEVMRRIDPGEYRLLLDAGVLYARVNRKFEAARALENYIAQAPNGPGQREAAILLRELKDF